MGIKTVRHPPNSPALILPVTFGYSLSSEAVIMRQLRWWKKLWRRSLTCSHKRTSMGPSRSCLNGTRSALQLEEITWKRTRVSCVYYQWKCPYEKCLETYLMILLCVCVYIYIYIYIYICVLRTSIYNVTFIVKWTLIFCPLSEIDTLKYLVTVFLTTYLDLTFSYLKLEINHIFIY